MSIGTRLLSILVGLALVLALAPAATPALAATLTVMSTEDASDPVPSDQICSDAYDFTKLPPVPTGKCTLRAALDTANTDPAPDTIVVPAGTYVLTRGTLGIYSTVTLTGAGASSTIVDGNRDPSGANPDRGARVLQIDRFDATVNISGVTIRNGRTPSGQGAGIWHFRGLLNLTDAVIAGNVLGGGLYQQGTARLKNVVISDNQSASGGGGIYNAGVSGAAGEPSLTLEDVTVENNRDGSGAGIYNISSVSAPVVGTNVVIRGNTTANGNGAGYFQFNGDTTLTNFVIEDNRSENQFQYGGGLSNDRGRMTLRNGVIRGNRAAKGGGMISDATLTIENVTITGNTATSTVFPYRGGGGIFLRLFDPSATAALQNVTISGNTSHGEGGGIHFEGAQLTVANATVANNAATDGRGIWAARNNLVLRNTILHNPGGNNCAGQYPVPSQGHNLSGDASCAASFTQPGDLNGTDSLLDALKGNGGATLPGDQLAPTHGLLAGSPAIDRGAPAGCTSATGAPLPTDQRGLPRPVDGDGADGPRCDVGAYELQAPFSNPGPTVASISPDAAVADSAGFTLTVDGTGFVGTSVVHWNGGARPTTFVSPVRLTAAIPASDLAAPDDVQTATVAVVSPAPGGGISNARPFTITSSRVTQAHSGTAAPGGTVTASTAPAAPGLPGVAATLNNVGGGPATVTAATYATNPTGGALFDAGGGFVDLQVTGSDPADAAEARFYYPTTVSAANEAGLELLYWTGTAWAPVRGSGGAIPDKNAADNLDGSTSGGRFTVTFSDTSTPKITELAGTVFSSSVLNSRPTGSAGGPYSVAEGGTVVLAATASDPDGEALTFAWDLDDDGAFEATGQQATFSAVGLDGPSSRPVRVRACDPSDACAVAAGSVTITNAPPAATGLTAPAAVAEGTSFTISLAGVSDPGTGDTLSVASDCGTGAPGASASCTAPFVGPAGGSIVVRGQVKDDDGGASEVYSTTVRVDDVMPTSADQCKRGGWQAFKNAGGTLTFKNQGDCVSFVATGGRNRPGGR